MHTIRHRTHSLILLLILCGLVSVILLYHGIKWWYAPMGGAVVIFLHAMIPIGLAMLFGGRWSNSRENSFSDREHVGHVHSDNGVQLHNPFRYDLLAQILTLGQEKKLRQWTLDLAHLQPGNSILDIGCGTGTLLIAAGKRLGQPGALHGIEPSTEMAGFARSKARQCNVPLEIVEGSADNLPYPDESFDVIFCTLVLHHLPQAMQEVTIRETRRVLRSGGRLVVVDWQRPNSFAKAIFSPLFLVNYLHSFGPSQSSTWVQKVELQLRDLGFSDVNRASFGAGGVVGAVVGRLEAGESTISRHNPKSS
jgi:ubiquinone/menaquinone biosynthesis C-methylase UbiE